MRGSNRCLLSMASTLVMIAAAEVRADSTLPVFTDGFDNAAFLAENYKPTPVDAWRAEDGRLVAKPSGVASAALKRDVPTECEVVVDVTPLELKNDFAGIILHGVNFLIRPDGYWCPYRVEGMEKSLGAAVKAELIANKKYQFRIVCRKVNEAKMFSWFVDDAKVAEFIESGKIQGAGFAFFANKMPIAYDNLSISRLVQGEVSSNLLGNSSFEVVRDGYPRGWNLGDPTPMLGVYDSIEKFWQSWALDHDAANVRSGKTALRLDSNGDAVVRSVQSGAAAIAINSPVTCSIYIKSDTDDLPVNMILWESFGKSHRQDFKVGKDWQRCQMVVKAPEKNNIHLGVELKAKGTIWLDDAQIELGDAATTYRPSAMESLPSATSEETISFPEKIELRRFKTSPLFDGKIEDVWQGVAKTDKFLIKGKNVPENKTEAFLGCDDDNLYLAFRCHSGDLAKIKTTAKEDNSGAIWADDCIEIFIDPALSRSRSLHLGLNAAGAKAAVDGKTLSRTDTWEVKTSLNPDGKCWEAEVRLPLCMLGLTQAGGDEWGINLCRNDTSKSEQSCTALTPRINFHDVAYYGSIVWPEGMLRKFALDVSDLRLSEAVEADNLVVSGVVRGASGGDKVPGIQFFVADKPVTEKKPLTLNDDNTAEFSLACDKGLAKQDTALTGKIVSREGMLLKHFEQTVKLEKRIDAYTQRNYYMNEENALLVANFNIPFQPGMAGVVAVTGNDGKRLWSGDVPALKRTMRVDVPIGSLPVGSYDVQFDIKNGDTLLASAHAPLLKMAYQKNGTQIDRERRCIIVDGKPFLVIAPLVHMFSHPQEYIRKLARHWSDAGFKTIMVVKNSTRPDFKQCFDDLLAACEEHGVKTILWPGYGWNDGAAAEPIVRPFMQAPSLIAWLPVDEPELYTTPDKVIRCINEFRKCDPYHPAFMNNSVMGIPSRYADLTTDILSIDDYVTKYARVADVIANVATMTKVGEKERKPSWMFLEGSNQQHHGREPTVGEQVAQSYGTIITGCSGMYYFMGQPSCKLHWETYKQINKELLSLSDVIFSLEEAPTATINTPAVIATTRRLGDSLYVISVNLEDKPVDAILRLPDGQRIGGSAEVLFENRSVNLKGAAIRDSYAPHERHVYKLDADAAGWFSWRAIRNML